MTRTFRPRSALHRWIASLLVAFVPLAHAGKLVIKGSNTFGEELGPHWIALYQKTHPDVTVELERKGSASGLAALLDGECDIAATSRPANEDELRQAASRGLTFDQVAIGHYAVALIVHPQNPLQGLSHRDVRHLFTGKETNWKQVGGADLPVRLYIRDPVAGTYLGFRELAMNDRPYAEQAEKILSYAEIARKVGQDPGGIGYVGMNRLADPSVKPLRINGVPPNEAAMDQNLYPYVRTVRLYTLRGKATPEAKAFLRFARSREAQAAMREIGFLPRQDLTGWRLPAP